MKYGRVLMTKREFLAMGLSIGGARALAQESPGAAPKAGASQSGRNQAISSRKAKTTKLFKAPPGFPNGVAVTPEGLWIGEQKLSGAAAVQYHLEEPKDLSEKAWLVDWNGKVLKDVSTPSRNTSGMAVGGGCVWMCANAPPQGVFQVDMNSKLISHRQIPLGPANDGGGCHGALYQDGKLWIVANRIRGILRVDAKTWTPEFMIPIYQTPSLMRYHGIAWDNAGARWVLAPFGSNDVQTMKSGDTAPAKLATGPGQYDGIEVLADGRILVSSWADSAVHVVQNGAMTKLVSNVSAPADIGVDTKRNVLAIPRFNDGKVEFYKIP
jgi:sugar lactone lactonase YvrE